MHVLVLEKRLLVSNSQLSVSFKFKLQYVIRIVPSGFVTAKAVIHGSLVGTYNVDSERGQNTVFHPVPHGTEVRQGVCVNSHCPVTTQCQSNSLHVPDMFRHLSDTLVLLVKFKENQTYFSPKKPTRDLK